MTIFKRIQLIDLSVPVRQRHSPSTGMGHTIKPQTCQRGESWMTYASADRLDSVGFDLRYCHANEVLTGSNLSSITSYACDEFDDQYIEPIVVRLPSSRGFLAGWSMGAGMLASVDHDLYEDAGLAAYAAHSAAEYAAEREYAAYIDDMDEQAEVDRLDSITAAARAMELSRPDLYPHAGR